MNIHPKHHDPLILSGRDVTAVLGPTNTGKTHLAIERMVAHESGVIGLPLRLLAREVYGRVVEKVGVSKVSLVTGEEKILPPNARYSVCTVEAMPRSTDAAFVAIDEIQLASDLERGHTFTDRILHLRGRQETLLLGAATMRGILERLLRGISVVTRPRLSHLAYAGSKKLTRLPRRSAIVAFSADEVYAIAELIRRQRGGAAVVLGALSPRTRNAQVALYQSGDVDYLVATDAIGMGLNLDVDHVAFAQQKKFDGFQHRPLTAAELGQIAGRAGRHLRDGTFGVTGQVDPLDDELVQKIEGHDFEPVKVLQWRSAQLDFASLDALKSSIETPAPVEGLTRALPSVDARALDLVVRDEAVRALADRRDRVALLWDVCSLPDYRKIAPAQHGELIAAIYLDIARRGHVDQDYMAEQVRRADSTDGDIDTLSNRIAQIRTWTFVSNRPGWLADPRYWQEKTRELEDRLSDALHERLTKRFVDRRTSVLMRRLRENTMLEAEIDPSGTVVVEGHHVGDLQGFRFTADQAAGGEDGKAIRAAAQKVLAAEFETRAERFSASGNHDIALASDGILRWIGAPIGTLVSTEDALKPRVILLADEQLTGPARDKVAARAERFVNFQIETILKPLVDLKQAEQLSGIARGIAYRLVENFGLIGRRDIADEVKSLDQEGRAALRRLGVRFGAYHIFVPSLVKPAPASIVTLLWTLKNDAKDKLGFGDVVHALASGRTSVVVNASYDKAFYTLSGYRILGRRAVRVDILERLADLIRPALAWKPGTGNRPDGGFDGRAFLATPAMMSILGASGEDMEEILRGLGYRADAKPAALVKTQIEALDAAAREAAIAAKVKARQAELDRAAAKAEAEAAAANVATEPAPTPDDAAEGFVTAPADVAPARLEPDAEVEAATPIAHRDDETEADVASTIAGEIDDVSGSGRTMTTASPEASEPESDALPVDAGEASDSASVSQIDVAASSPGESPATPDAVVEEPKPILLWRPARFERPPRHQHGNRVREGAQPGQRDNRRPPPQAAPADASAPRPAQPPRDARPRFDRNRFKPNPDAPKPEVDRPQRNGQSRPSRDRPTGADKDNVQPRPPAREERPLRVDPDSPFAKLAALRDQLKK